MPGTSVLIIDHGDPPSLASILTARDARSITIWHPTRASDHQSDAFSNIARRHAAIYADGQCLRARVPVSGNLDLDRSVLIFAAATTAVTRGCSRLISPVSAAGEIDRMLLEVDRANLAAALIDLGGDGSGLQIDLPVVDLDDWQIVDLIVEGGGALHDAWPCSQASSIEPCSACPSCRRWRAACERLELDWPWDVVSVAERPLSP